jgi:PleD family two-component response regulator
LSIGIADASALGLESALHHADNALYEAKTQGRNRVVAASTPAEPPQRPLRMV